MATSKKAPSNQIDFHDELSLSPQEEQVLRMHEGVTFKEEILERKTKDPELLARLLELEQAIYRRAKSRKA